MSAAPDPSTQAEDLLYAQNIIRCEAQALLGLAHRLDESFHRAVNRIVDCKGSVIVLGVGKSGYVGQKISATLASTGTPSHFVHPAEAIHGDLGRIRADDIALVLSHSGETSEVTSVLASLEKFGVPIIAITSEGNSSLGQAATVALLTGKMEEACALALAPTTSTTAMMALGDALALVASHRRGFAKEDFARFHPGGSLGRKLAKVEEAMRPLGQCRVSRESEIVRRTLSTVARRGRRSGALMAVDSRGRLTGIFTDSDLARLLETHNEELLDGPLRNVMTQQPVKVRAGSSLNKAIEIMSIMKISELPVVDSDGRLLGHLDVTDILSTGELQSEESVDPPVYVIPALDLDTNSPHLDV